MIGAAKSGTTTLYQWLVQQPEVFAGPLKEPRFFSRDWHLGLHWYAGLFAGATPNELVGDASTSYTDVHYSAVAAERLARLIPEARILYVVRHPVDRLCSQYRHNWRRAAESASFAKALERPGNPYLGRSLYHSRLLPYIERFSRHQICVVRFEDLVYAPHSAWNTVLSHLGLPLRASPGDAHNVTDAQPQISPVLRRLDQSDWLDRLPRPPMTIRKPIKSILARVTRRTPATTVLDVPIWVLDQLWTDVRRLEAWLGTDLLWERTL